MKLEWKLTIFTSTNPQGETSTHQAKEAVGTGLGYVIYEPGDDEPDEIPFHAVTHMPSGSRLHRSPILHEQQAKRFVAALLPLLNWNRPTDELTADPEYKNAIMQVGKIYDQVDEKFWEDLEETREWECWPEGLASA